MENTSTLGSIVKGELEDFLSKVDKVNQTIAGLVNGTISTQESVAIEEKLFQATIKNEEKSIISKEAKNEEEEKASNLPYREGSGMSENYSFYCTPCHYEYISSNIIACVKCSSPLISRSTRIEVLQQKIKELNERKQQRAARRARFAAYKSSLASSSDSTSPNSLSSSVPTPAQLWDDFEPSSDEDDSFDKNKFSNNPTFAAMEADIENRHQKRINDAKESNKFKLEGNDYYKNKQYTLAIESYSKAINLVRSDTTLYTNRALGYINTNQYENAIKDCNKAIDICIYYHNQEEREKRGMKCSNNSIASHIKALLRRADSYRLLNKYNEAKADVMEYMSLMGKVSASNERGKYEKEGNNLLRKIQKDQEEEIKEQQLEIQSAPSLSDNTRVANSFEEKEQLLPSNPHSSLLSYLQSPQLSLPPSISTVRALTLETDKNDIKRVSIRTGGLLDGIMGYLRINKKSVAAGTNDLNYEILLLFYSCLLNYKNKLTFINQSGVDLLWYLIDNTNQNENTKTQNINEISLLLLKSISEVEEGRKDINKNKTIINSFLTYIEPNTKSISPSNPTKPSNFFSPLTQSYAISLLSNLLYDTNNKQYNTSLIIPHLDNLILLLKSEYLPLLCSCISLLANLVMISVVKERIINNNNNVELICACLNRLMKNNNTNKKTNKSNTSTDLRECREKILILFINLTIDTNPHTKSISLQLYKLTIISLPSTLSILYLAVNTVNIVGTAADTVFSSELIVRILQYISRGCNYAEFMSKLLENDMNCFFNILSKGKEFNISKNTTIEYNTENNTFINYKMLELTIRILTYCSKQMNVQYMLMDNINIFNYYLNINVCNINALGNIALLLGTLAISPVNHCKLSVFLLPLLNLIKLNHNNDNIEYKECNNNAAIAVARLSAYKDNVAIIKGNNGMGYLAAAGKLNKK